MPTCLSPRPVSGTFLNTLKFTVRDCDPVTGEPDDEQGFADEYVVSRGLIVCIVPQTFSCSIYKAPNCEATLCVSSCLQ